MDLVGGGLNETLCSKIQWLGFYHGFAFWHAKTTDWVVIKQGAKGKMDDSLLMKDFCLHLAFFH